MKCLGVRAEPLKENFSEGHNLLEVNIEVILSAVRGCPSHLLYSLLSKLRKPVNTIVQPVLALEVRLQSKIQCSKMKSVVKKA